MATRCLILDQKNRIIDYADLSYPPDGSTELTPSSAEVANSFDKGDVVKFQYEQRFDKVFDAVVIKNRKNRLVLDKVRHISNILQEDLRIEVFKDAVLTYQEDTPTEEEKPSETENEDETINEDETKDENATENEDNNGKCSFDITVKDISSGGICFYSKENLPMDRIYEYVADWGVVPVVTKVKLLRKEKLDFYTYSYGCKFVELFAEEERALRGAVFAIQARRCQDRRKRENDIF